MKINLTSVYVEDQTAALRFYTEILGFVKKTEIPMADVSWLTVVSPDATAVFDDTCGNLIQIHG